MRHPLVVMIFALLIFSPAFSQTDSLKGVITVRKHGHKASFYVKTEYDYNRFGKNDQVNFYTLPAPPVPDTVNYFRELESPDMEDTLAVLQQKRKPPAAQQMALITGNGQSGFDISLYLKQNCLYSFAPADTVMLDSVRVEYLVNDSGRAALVLIPWNENDTLSSAFSEAVMVALKPLWLWHPALDTSSAVPYSKPCAVIYTIYAIAFGEARYSIIQDER